MREQGLGVLYGTPSQTWSIDRCRAVGRADGVAPVADLEPLPTVAVLFLVTTVLTLCIFDGVISVLIAPIVFRVAANQGFDPHLPAPVRSGGHF
jgi:hypothetical protein